MISFKERTHHLGVGLDAFYGCKSGKDMFELAPALKQADRGARIDAEFANQEHGGGGVCCVQEQPIAMSRCIEPGVLHARAYQVLALFA